MENEKLIWHMIGELTYAGMLSFAAMLRDVADNVGLDVRDVDSWATILNSAREAFEAGIEPAQTLPTEGEER